MSKQAVVDFFSSAESDETLARELKAFSERESGDPEELIRMGRKAGFAFDTEDLLALREEMRP